MIKVKYTIWAWFIFGSVLVLLYSLCPKGWQLSVVGIGGISIGVATTLYTMVRYGVLKYSDKLHWWYSSPKHIIREKKDEL